MKINTAEVVRHYNGDVIKDDKGKDLTFFTVFEVSLNDFDEATTAEVKSVRFRICNKMYQDKNVDITTDEGVAIKAAVGKVYGPIIVGRTEEFIDKMSEK